MRQQKKSRASSPPSSHSLNCQPPQAASSSLTSRKAPSSSSTIILAFAIPFLLCGNAGALPSKTAYQDTSLSPPPNSTLWYLQKTLTGIDRAMSFFEREYKDVNLDALIGTRILEGTFNVIIRKLYSDDLVDAVPDHVVSHIIRLRDAARDVSKAATPYVIANEPDYFARIGPVIAEGLFELDYDSRDVDPFTHLWPYNSKEVMKEDNSDDCLAELFGTANGLPCSISNKCWNLMTAPGYNKYSLSHEIFYLQIAEKSHCQTEMRWKILTHKQTSLKHLHDTFCGNMLAEANLIADKEFPEDSQDLFMEQGALCGMLGYREFFSSEWLMEILSWQDPKDGCYRWDEWPKPEHGASESENKKGRRYKREEKRVSRDCLCHRTTVALSALSQYVRFILEVWFQETVTHELAP